MRIARERRHRRSDNTTLALHYQLDACRQAAKLEGLILSDEDGFCLATSGDPHACQEVAAQLPFIGRKVPDFEGVLLGTEGGWRIRMHRFGVPGGQLFLCAIGPGGTERERQLALSRGAVRRILEPRADAM
ncbi:MAG TPA: hypothetical protein VK698_13685 [Kofleriaceae bacterium]|nr:hypothetical protein [Kofleriaceae bacterium]